MKPGEEKSNTFIKQVSKIFEELSTGQKAKPAGPRITCTRLKRLQEIRRELVNEPEADLSIDAETKSLVSQLSNEKTKDDSFAAWVMRNKQAREQSAKKRSESNENTSTQDNKTTDSDTTTFTSFSPSALQTVANNPNTPASTLKWLASHCRVQIRQSVARNPNAGNEIINILARDTDDSVREALLDNPSLTTTIILKLCDDPNPLISEKAKNVFYESTKAEQSQILTSNEVVTSEMNPVINGLEIKDKESELIEREFLQVIADRATTPPRRLAELAKHQDKIIRGLVAANPNATPEILWKLAKDKTAEVRIKLLSNYNCPPEILEYLRKGN